MKYLELSNYSVHEMNAIEMKEVEGGLLLTAFLFGLACGFLVGALAIGASNL